MNPDGAQFDIKGGHFHFWRKNRQPTPGSSAIGTDLNRNYGYRWGARRPDQPEPRGDHVPRARGRSPRRRPAPCATSSPRRVVGGRQQIRAAITFHEAGRLVMWPYGYTKKNVPPDMTSLDHHALRDDRPPHGEDQRLQARAGRATCTSPTGASRDYLYGTYRIFAYTFEMSVRDYPKTPLIAPETGRNKEAVL